MYIPGCMEHYLVHTMRSHEDFIPELDFVLELDGKIIGYIMYTKATLTDEAGNVKNIVTFGSPSNYVSSGFVSCKRHNICVNGDKFPAAMLIRELKPGILDGRKWYYKDSPVMAVLPEDAIAYDDTLSPKERKHTPAQEAFYIMSHSFVEG